jgi:3-oxoadipate enol-lactonase
MEKDVAARPTEWDLFAGVSGTGSPFVFLHGQFGTHEVVRHLISALERSLMLITPDVRGRGRSICPDQSLHNWNQYAEDVITVLDDLSIAQTTIGGVSLGAGVALATALRFSNRVSALVLHSPVYAGEARGWLPSQKELQERVLATAKRVSEEGFEALEAESPGAVAKWKRHDQKSITAALLGLGLSQPFHAVEELRQITQPTLIISGFDALHPPEVSQIYADNIPQTRSVESLPVDAESTTAVIADFLKDAAS